MPAVRTWQVGDIEIARVDDPGHELVLPQDEATVAVLRRSPWLQPHFVTDDWSLRIGSSATVVRSHDDVVLVDPFLAFDDPSRADRRVQALHDAGVSPADVTVVVNTHVDGIGVNLDADGGAAFKNARYFVPRAELEALRAGTHVDTRGAPLLELWRDGVVAAADGGEVVARGVRLEDAPGHNPGHEVVWVEDGGETAVVIGHLFLHPAQISNVENQAGDLDPTLLARTRRAVLARCVDTDATLIGPLFADPGGGMVEAAGDAWRLDC